MHVWSSHPVTVPSFQQITISQSVLTLNLKSCETCLYKVEAGFLLTMKEVASLQGARVLIPKSLYELRDITKKTEVAFQGLTVRKQDLFHNQQLQKIPTTKSSNENETFSKAIVKNRKTILPYTHWF